MRHRGSRRPRGPAERVAIVLRFASRRPKASAQAAQTVGLLSWLRAPKETPQTETSVPQTSGVARKERRSRAVVFL